MKSTLCLLVLSTVCLAGCAHSTANIGSSPISAEAINSANIKDKILQRRIGEMADRSRKNPREVLDFQIGFEKHADYTNGGMWVIWGTEWSVQLYVGGGLVDMAKLDKTKTYQISGLALEQNYGRISVWLLDPSSLVTRLSP